MKLFIQTVVFLFFSLNAGAQLDLDACKAVNKSFVNKVSKSFDRDFKHDKIKKKNKKSIYAQNLITVSDWETLKSKHKKEFIESLYLDEILSQKEIEEYYNLHQFIEMAHISFHACMSELKRKDVNRINGQLFINETICNQVLVAYWNEDSRYKDKYEQFKSYVYKISESERIQKLMSEIDIDDVKKDQYPITAFKLLFEAISEDDGTNLNDRFEQYKMINGL